jgi:tRNA1(Val) A37 N6-methylase TrmN6
MTLQTIDMVNDDKTEILIPADQWTSMLENYSQDDIKAVISAAIDEFDIPMPMRKITEQDAIIAFNDLCDYDVNTLIKSGDTFSRYDYTHDMGTDYLSQCRVGNAASDYFHQYNRFLCDSINAPSPYRSWTNPKFRNGILNALFTLKFKEVNMTKLRSAIALRKYIASTFKPVIAKAVYEIFDSKNILDFSSGWGDRLAGFYAAEGALTYTGIDPNTNLQAGYTKQIEMYSALDRDKTAKVIEGCAEDILPDMTERFDTIFTSPPFFNIEKYTHDDNQSFKRYRKFDGWMNGFLLPVVEMAWNKLKPNGVMIVNIADVYSGHRINQICDRMIDFVETLPNSKFAGSLSMQMAKRPNSNATRQNGVFVEPMWIFEKN